MNADDRDHFLVVDEKGFDRFVLEYDLTHETEFSSEIYIFVFVYFTKSYLSL